MSLKFYLTIIKHSLRDSRFRAGAMHEAWGLVRGYLPGRLVTPRSKYVFCQYAGRPSNEGRWLPPQSLAFRPSAYALIFDEQERVLLVTASAFDTDWYLPGGGLNKGETLVEGVQREVREETGLEVEVGPVLDATDIFRIMPTGRAVQSQLHYFLAKPIGGELHPQGNGFDSSGARYLDLDTTPRDELQSADYLYYLVKRARLLGQSLGFLPSPYK